MGNILSDVRDQVEKASGNDQAEKAALETLKNMEQMAKDAMVSFYDRIENSAHDAKQIPIKSVLTKYTFLRAMTKKDEQIGDAIKSCVTGFAGDNPVRDGLTNMASTVISTLLGSSAGMRATEEKYAIQLNEIGGLARLDTFFFVYNFQSEALIQKTSSVVACCVVKSSADITNIDDNTFKVVVGNCFETSPPRIQRLIFGDIYWDIIRPKKSPPTLTPAEEKEKSSLKEEIDKYWHDSTVTKA